MGIPRLFLTAVAIPFALTASPRPSAASSEEDLSRLEDPSATSESLLRLVAEAAPRLALDRTVSDRTHGVVLSSRGSVRERDALVGEIQGHLDAARKALEGWGIRVPEEVPETFVVFASVSGYGDALLCPNPATALVRRGAAGPPKAQGPPPALPPGVAGCYEAESLAAAAREIRAWAAASRASRSLEGTGSLRQFLARRLVAAAYPGGAPPWFLEGLSVAAEMRSRSADAAAPVGHVPGPFAGKAGALRSLLDGWQFPPGSQRLLARVVAVQLANAAGRGSFLAAVPKATSADAAAAAFGPGFDAVFSETVTGAAAASTCDADGRMRCVLCKGLGRVEVECANCRRTGKVTCRSCVGNNQCRNGACKDGSIRWDNVNNDRVNDCKMCNKGKTYCKACDGKIQVSCAVCKGKGRHRVACPGCVGGFLPCGDCPLPDRSACRGCSGKGSRACPVCIGSGAPPAACADCAGTGYVACETCHGAAKTVCKKCSGSGDEIKVYSGDNTVASAHQCNGCQARGWLACNLCEQRGRMRCPKCDTRGTLAAAPCFLCAGAGTQPCPACGGK